MYVSPDEITSLAVAVGRLEQKVDDRDNKLDAIHRSLDRRLDTIDEKVTQTNGRVKAAELNDAKLKGMFLVFAGASPFLVALLAAWLAHVFAG